jgi:hypothetical protein
MGRTGDEAPWDNRAGSQTRIKPRPTYRRLTQVSGFLDNIGHR